MCEHPIASLHGWGATNLGIEFKFTGKGATDCTDKSYFQQQQSHLFKKKGAEKSLFYCTSNSNKITDLLIASLNEIKEETQQKVIHPGLIQHAKISLLT